MLGLIKKDLYLIKGNLKRVLLVLVIFSLMAVQGSFDITFIIPFISTMIFISTFSYDEYNKWDAYAITLPNGKRNVVKSKYLCSVMLIIVSIVLTIVLSLIIGMIKEGSSIDTLISSSLGITFGLVILNSIMYPLIFRFGVEKGRIALFGLVAGFTAVISIVIAYLKDLLTDPFISDVVTFFNEYGYFVLPLLMIIIIYISYIISVKIYNKKEF